MKKVLSTPVARALAAKNNLDIKQIIGTGPRGRILKQDVMNFKNNSSLKEPQKDIKNDHQTTFRRLSPMEDKRVKHSPLRKGIARALKTSWDNVAYVNLVNEIDATKLWDYRAKIKDKILADTGVKLTFLPFIVIAIIKSIKKYPIFNAKHDPKTDEMIYQKDINIGIAVDTEKGLYVPVIKKADQLSLIEIASEISRLAKECKDGTISPAELKGSTYTITNYGTADALFGVPVINYPNIAISGVGAIKDKLYYKNEKVSPGKVLFLTTAGDHQWIDGANIGRFAYETRILLENPAILLASY
ncbi:MAG: 2-oxo acid dehydrogenase subunit E2 [Mycoplasmatales bacterium]|nr:2-oxo acid dehydrogenase subunit E2 [Mycoplasmatales bacterium]